MQKRDEIKRRLQAALTKYAKEKSPEWIAVKMEVRYPTIMNWMTGRRVPKNPAIRQFEHLSGLKVLEEGDHGRK